MKKRGIPAAFYYCNNSLGGGLTIIREDGHIEVIANEHVHLINRNKGIGAPEGRAVFSKKLHPETYRALNRLGKILKRQYCGKPSLLTNYYCKLLPPCESEQGYPIRKADDIRHQIGVHDNLGNIIEMQVAGVLGMKPQGGEIAYVRFSLMETPTIFYAIREVAIAIANDNISIPRKSPE